MPPRFPQSGDLLHPGGPVSAGLGAAAGAPPPAPAPRPRPPAPPPRSGTVTFPPGSTIVLPVGSGNEPCKNHAGVPSTAGPDVGVGVCEKAIRPLATTPSVSIASPAK